MSNDKWDDVREFVREGRPLYIPGSEVVELLDERDALIKDRDFHVVQCTELDASRLRLMDERDRLQGQLGMTDNEQQGGNLADNIWIAREELQRLKDERERLQQAIEVLTEYVDCRANEGSPVAQIYRDKAQRILKGEE